MQVRVDARLSLDSVREVICHSRERTSTPADSQPGRDSMLVERRLDSGFRGNGGSGLQRSEVSFRYPVLCPRLEALTLTEPGPLSIL